MGEEFINVAGQFLDSLLSIYFMHKFFSAKSEKREYAWVIAAVVMTVLTQALDHLSQNDTTVWMLQLFVIPFLYAVLFEKGSLLMKLLAAEIPCVILIALENFNVAAIIAIRGQVELTQPVYLLLYLFRRIISKVVLLLAVRFLLSYSITGEHYKFRKYRYLLGAINFFEFLCLLNMKGPEKTLKSQMLYMVFCLFCFFVPILFYYLMYLTEENLEKLQVSISQKNYIEAQEQYMQQLITMDECLRKFKHDYQAHLFCMDNLLLDKNYEELHEYLNNLHGMKKKYYRIQSYTPDRRLNMILNQMREQAEKKDICFQVSAKNAFVKTIELYDLNMLLSNLFNNAAEAAAGTEERIVELNLDKNRAYFQIMISNSVAGNPLENNPNLITDKDDKDLHGFGMAIIRSVVEKYQGILQMDGSEDRMVMKVLLLDEKV